jgi:ABC-type multidrug transport system fused ATPase/permease subunit
MAKQTAQEKRTFKREFGKTFATGIIAAFGLIVALAWRDVINEYLLTTILGPVQGKIISAIIVTVIAAIVILIISKFSSN